MKFHYIRSSVVIGVAVVAPLVLTATPVHGQDTSAAPGAIEEVVVTARGQREFIQDIPLSVTNFSADEIEAAGINDLEGIAVRSPGLQFNTQLSGLRTGRLSSNMRFRGIQGSEFSSLQTGSLYIDGVFVLQGAQSISLADIERVEVIRGPQSAKFGRNSFGGAINYVTKTPNLQQFSGRFAADAGQYGQFEVSAGVEGPIIEHKLALRVGVRSYRKGEMYTASDGGALGEESSESVFATLYAEPSDNSSIKVRAFYQIDDDGPAANGLLKFTGTDQVNDTCTGTSRSGFDAEGNRITLNPTNAWCGTIPKRGANRAPPVDSNTSLRPQFPSFTGREDFLITNLMGASQIGGIPDIDSLGIKREMVRVSLTGEYMFENDISVRSIIAYNDNIAAHVRDFDLSPIESWWVSNPQSGNDKSFDLTVTSAQDQRLRWLAGFNYYDQEFLTAASGGTHVHVCGNFAGLLDPTGASGDFCDFPGIFVTSLDGGDFVEVWSVYGSVSFDITEKLNIDLEGRYQVDQRSDGISDIQPTFRDFIPRVTVTYKPTDNVTTYALATQGLLPGVVNANLAVCNDQTFTEPFVDPFTGQPSTSSECQQIVEQIGSEATEITEQQTLDSAEIGIKTTWMQNRLSINFSAYHQKWNDQPFPSVVQVFRDDNLDGIPNTNPNGFFIARPGSSKYYGAELESELWLKPNWVINYNLSYNENEFSRFQLGPRAPSALSLGTTNVKGHRSSRFPEWSWNLSSTYRHEGSGAWNISGRADVMYQGEATTGAANLATLQDYFVVNARVGLEGENARLELYVTNIFDEQAWRTGSNIDDFTLSGNGFDFSNPSIILIPQDRRTVGVRVSYQF